MGTYPTARNWRVISITPMREVPTTDGRRALKNLKSDYASRRILMGELGMEYWVGGDSFSPRHRRFTNHRAGYNLLYFDGHVKFMPYGRKWTILSASGWPPEQCPTCP
jgi:prepilin-type processing-associated H-X9-DG protein